MAIAAYPRKGTIILFIDGKLYDGFIAAYPRKGTIARTGCCCSNLLHIAAYPRKGTITMAIHVLNVLAIGLQLIPARGR